MISLSFVHKMIKLGYARVVTFTDILLENFIIILPIKNNIQGFVEAVNYTSVNLLMTALKN